MRPVADALPTTLAEDGSAADLIVGAPAFGTAGLAVADALPVHANPTVRAARAIGTAGLVVAW
jgi:hypothetical protein